MKPVRLIWKTLLFLAFYGKEILKANFRVAFDVITPRHLMKPAMVATSLSADLSDIQLYILSNLITTTPGTLSVDVSTDRRTLYVHAMYVRNPDDVREEVRIYQERIKELTL
jgi:multicomponent Na+:H+ antiporter subunit E